MTHEHHIHPGPDHEHSLSTDHPPGHVHLNDSSPGLHGHGHHDPGWHEDDKLVFGTPVEDASFWRPQAADFTCAIQAQACILHEFTGQEIHECNAAVEAAVNGWLRDHLITAERCA